MRLQRHDELVEAMARAIWAIEWPAYQWPELHKPSQERDRIIKEAASALDALLDAAVRLEVGRKANLMVYGTGNTPEKLAVKHWCADTPGRGEDKVLDALIIRLEASDDK